jgi:hypothetical protein
MTQQEAREKLKNCKFWPNSMEEQKQILEKLKEAGYFYTSPLVDKDMVSIFTHQHSELTFDFEYDPKYFINREKKQVNISDLLKIKIEKPLEPKDFKIIKIESNCWANAFLFQTIFPILQSYTQEEENFTLFMQAGEALVDALDLTVYFSIKGKSNPGIGWDSYNDVNPWFDFIEHPLENSKCSSDDIIKFLKTFPINSELKIIYNE